MPDESLESTHRSPADDPFFIGEVMSRRAKAFNVLLLAMLIAGSVMFVWLMSSLPRIEGPMPVKGIHLPATIARDHFGVPRITARSVRDAYFALGWVHAQDRIWQMELQRRVASGRLAEIVGERGLGNDRFMRTLGLFDLARQSFVQLDRPTRDALSAYADGVNAWLDGHRHRLPVEFFLLGVTPEPWTPADSLVWARLMALQLTNNWRDELLAGKLAGRLDAQRLRELWPAYPADAPVSVAGGTVSGVLDALPDTARPHLASNVWAVDGKRTASGKPLLANDPHLGFQAPVLWYLASVEAPGLTLAGATVPGVPFHLIGHNGRIAWGTTTTHADTVDLYAETLSGNGYVTPQGPRPFETRTEVIKVKGGEDVTLTVRTTRHGPVVSDLLGKDAAAEGTVLAMRATALEPDDLSAQGVFRMNRAVDWKGFRAATADFHAPVQNFAYADTTGTIGFLTAGRVPVRKSGNGSVPVDGTLDKGEWTGWIPADRMPQTLNPRSGQVINANNKVTAPSYPYLISAQWPEGYRARRIETLLAGRKDLTAADMADMQMDDLSLAAVELKDLLSDTIAVTPVAQKALELILAWDGRAAADRPEPLIFAAWMRELWRAVMADELGEDFTAFTSPRPYVLRDALTVNRHWCDDVATPEAEGCDTQASRALEKAVSAIAARRGAGVEAWRWGDEHKAVFAHPILGRLPLADRFATIAVPSAGDDFTVNRGTFAADGFTQVHGPGLRAVFDLADLSRSRFIVATGQSGNLLSRHYDDMTARWRVNDGIPVGTRQGEISVLTLEPSY